MTVAASEVYWLLILMGLRFSCLSIVGIFSEWVRMISSEADGDRISSMSGSGSSTISGLGLYSNSAVEWWIQRILF